MLKLRDVAKTLYKIEVGNGCNTSFCFDKWSEKGILYELLGERGVIDMGINKEASVAEAVLSTRRRRRHRRVMLNEAEAELLKVAEKMRDNVDDISLWRRTSGFKSNSRQRRLGRCYILFTLKTGGLVVFGSRMLLRNMHICLGWLCWIDSRRRIEL